jgi:hypothetical protein
MIRSRIQKEREKLQWLRDTSQINTDNLNIVIGETNRHFGKKNTKESLKVTLITLKQTARTGMLEICIEA